MAKLRRRLTQDDVDRIAEMDVAKGTYFQRDPLRPDNAFAKRKKRSVPIEVKRAQGRMRTARWRSSLDKKRAPTVADVGMALAAAIATTNWSDKLTPADFILLSRALHDMDERGFDVKEAAQTLRRLRNRLVDPADRAGEESEIAGVGGFPNAWEQGERRLPF